MMCMMHMNHDEEHESQHSQHHTGESDSAQLKAEIEELRKEIASLRAALGVPDREIDKAHNLQAETHQHHSK